MASPKFIIIGAVVVILLLQGFTQGAFLNLVMPGWETLLGNAFCIAGGFIVQPVWDAGWAKIPVPTTDDFAAGTLFAMVAAWFIRRTKWTYKRKLIAIFAVFFAGITIYKAIGMLLLYWAEMYYGMQGCIGEFSVGPLTIQWEWFNPLFWLMIVFSMVGLLSVVYGLRKKAGDGDGK